MFHKILSTIGLGVLGIDPITAIVMTSMGLKKDNKIKITLFAFSFMFFSIVIGTVISMIFGPSALELINNLIPSDDSKVWAILEITISLIILVWVLKKIFIKRSKTKEEPKKVRGSYIKYLTTGIIFALTCFTDPTYYAVILLGCETNSFILTLLLVSLWFLVSQILSVIVYIAIELNLLKRLIAFIDKIKSKWDKKYNYIIYGILLLISLMLLIDSIMYLTTGNYLF